MDWLDWILLVARVVVVFFAVLITVMLLIWMERKVAADMQTRMGPMRAGPRGVLITLADGIKLFFKEGITPTLADRPVYLLAPVIAMIPAFLAFAVIPFGTGVTLFGRPIKFQIADLNVGILWVLAMGSLMVYGIVLAGWSSGSNYPLLGSIRSMAQMISYEVGMGLALVAVLMYSGSLQMSDIVASQGGYFHLLWVIPVPRWNLWLQFPAFAIYLIAGTGIGAGILSGGRLVRGAHELSGCAGWMVFHTGGIAHLEQLAAGPAVGAVGSLALNRPGLTAREVVAAARAGNRAAREVVRRAATLLGLAVANLISLFDPEVIVLGGGLGASGETLLAPLRRTALEWAQPLAARQVRITASRLGGQAPLLGAARLAFDRLDPEASEQ